MQTKAIYSPRGKAKEYCDLAVNLYHGCDHGCRYCYAPAATYKTREEFMKPRHRPGVIEAIRKELLITPPSPSYLKRGQAKRGGVTPEILLCFTCDPYSKFAAASGITRQAIQTLHAGGANVTILTKGGERSTIDFDLLGNGDKYGGTLTFVSNIDSREWEPWAALPGERLVALQEAHRRGITTWASLEPVIDPEQSLEIINRTHEFVDIYKVGKWNHDARAKEIDWETFGQSAVSLLKKYGKQYIIKKDLEVFIKGI